MQKIFFFDENMQNIQFFLKIFAWTPSFYFMFLFYQLNSIFYDLNLSYFS